MSRDTRSAARRRLSARLPALAAVGLLSGAVLASDKPDVRAAIVAPARATAGSRATVIVAMTLGTDWHVNSHTPSEKYLIATVVSLSVSEGDLSPIRYPKDVERRFPFSDKPLRVYEGTVQFETDLQLPPNAGADISVKGFLSYQACNHQQCFAPAKIPLEARVPVAGAEKSAAADLAAASFGGDAVTPAEADRKGRRAENTSFRPSLWTHKTAANRFSMSVASRLLKVA